MGQSIFKLEKILDLNKWQALQDSLSQVTRLAIITVDYKGIPITVHSNCHPFCQKVRNDPELSKRCQKCDSRGGLEAVRSNKPYIYLCHYNIVDIAIPISIADKYVGAIMAGQIRLSDSDIPNDIEQILYSKTSISLLQESEDLQTIYGSIPILPFSDINCISQMLFTLCNYIVDEAKNKNYILEMYENLLSVGNQKLSNDDLNINNIAQLKNALSNAVTNTYINSELTVPSSVKNKLLIPVFDYIFANKNKNLSLNDAAALGYVSPSYFSRIFTYETGENFTVYVSKLKVEWAKQLLEKTNLSVTQISEELGFNDPGYFIKIFKKYEAVTPALYRKYYQA